MSEQAETDATTSAHPVPAGEPPEDGLGGARASLRTAAGRVAGAADRVAGAADAAASTLANVADAAASTIVDAAAIPVAGVATVAREVGDITTEARRRIGRREGARVRQVRRRAAQRLPNLYEDHPEVRRASLRELGLQTVPIDRIRGTAVEGPAQRGGDFLPIKRLRGHDWRARWQRINDAIDRLVDLPPVELLRFGDDYWVVDGHNRVAAALYSGQGEIDAVVIDLRLPGMRRTGTTSSIAGLAEDARDMRAAGAGRFTTTAVRPVSVRGVPHVEPEDVAEPEERETADRSG